jgi:hypothetical protein
MGASRLISSSSSDELFNVSPSNDNHVAHKLAVKFNKLSRVDKRVQLLQSYASSIHKHCDRYQDLYNDLQRKRGETKSMIDTAVVTMERHAQFSRAMVLKTCAHIQAQMYDNQDAMCRACVGVLKGKLAAVTATVDALGGHPTMALTPVFFKAPADFCAENSALKVLCATRMQLETRLQQSKSEYVQVSKQIADEEGTDRRARVRRVIDATVAFYASKGVHRYEPCPQEFEFSRLVLDERCKEGQLLQRWFGMLERRHVQAESILAFLAQFVDGVGAYCDCSCDVLFVSFVSLLDFTLPSINAVSLLFYISLYLQSTLWRYSSRSHFTFNQRCIDSWRVFRSVAATIYCLPACTAHRVPSRHTCGLY